MIDITVVVCTKNRAESTLAPCLMSIACQTYKPKELRIYDDSDEFKNQSLNPIYKTILDYLMLQGIMWYWDPGMKLGQVSSHIRSIEAAKYDFIFRIDDDCCLEKDCLEKLVRNIDNKTGAVGGLIIPNGQFSTSSIASNSINDIYLGLNRQWFIHYGPAYEVDHLYSSFLYRKSIAKYCTELSPVGHREETMLTHQIKLTGHKIILEPAAKMWHFRNPIGGIRSFINSNYWANDERIFSRYLADNKIIPNNHSFVVLENGIGDHFAFKSLLPPYFLKNKEKKHIFFVTYPDVFKDIKDIQLASIAEAKYLFNNNIDQYNVYKFMTMKSWKQSLVEAYKNIYQLSDVSQPNIIRKKCGDVIIISPYSFRADHAKSYPYWVELISMLKALRYKIVQIGTTGESIITGVDDFLCGLSFDSLQQKISECYCWIAVDNFLQHMCNCMENVVPGIVIFGVSDPNIFGYSHNKNILKSREFLRNNQFDVWQGIKQNTDAFYKADEMMKQVKDFLNCSSFIS